MRDKFAHLERMAELEQKMQRVDRDIAILDIVPINIHTLPMFFGCMGRMMKVMAEGAAFIATVEKELDEPGG